jgi:bifunctional non-homologous end joining protein LigD
VIDLDPDPALTFKKVKEAALRVHRSFEAIGLTSFTLLSGGKGIHVIVPLEPAAERQQVEEFTKSFCAALSDAAPERFTIALSKAERRGRIFFDFLRNHRTATAVMPYSARARSGMPIAAPVDCGELQDIECAGTFTIDDVEQLRSR